MASFDTALLLLLIWLVQPLLLWLPPLLVLVLVLVLVLLLLLLLLLLMAPPFGV
jgi:hypothetical protein